MSKYCMICRNTACQNHGKNITLFGDSWQCDYIPTSTNADRIRAMSDEELATELLPLFEELCEDGIPSTDYMPSWLKQTGEEDT